jgi:hypothetical protein
MKAIGGQPDHALGSVHAITRDGTLVIASACYAWGAASVIFVMGAQKARPLPGSGTRADLQAQPQLENAPQAAYGLHSSVGKVLEIRQELPGGIYVVLIRPPVGF